MTGPEPKCITVDEFDKRASGGDSMTEYFSNYVPCDLDVDALIEEISAEKQDLENGVE